MFHTYWKCLLIHFLIVLLHFPKIYCYSIDIKCPWKTQVFGQWLDYGLPQLKCGVRAGGSPALWTGRVGPLLQILLSALLLPVWYEIFPPLCPSIVPFLTWTQQTMDCTHEPKRNFLLQIVGWIFCLSQENDSRQLAGL